MRITSIFIFISFVLTISAQEFHYWNNQVGARSSMLGGAVTAADSDNSAIYYNPGALGFNENSSLSLSSDVYYYSWLNIKNGAGKDMDLISNEFNVFPQIIAYNQKVPKLPLTITLAGINRDNSFINTSYRNEMEGDYIEELPGDEIYVGTVDYYNRLVENWMGFGYGRKISDNFGLGASIFVSNRGMEFRYTEEADIYKIYKASDDIGLVSNAYTNDYFSLRNVGLIFLLGGSYQKEKFKFGFNITFPRVNLGFLSRSDLRRNFSYDIPSIDTITRKYSNWQNNVKSTYKTPFNVDFGVEFKVSPSTTLYGKIAWFSSIDRYPLIESDNSKSFIASTIDGLAPDFDNIFLANKMVVNGAIAIEKTLNQQISILGGVRTDFNYFDRDAIDQTSDFYPGISYWDIFHLSGGVIWTQEKFDLSLGASYSIGRDNSLPQIINLSDPVEEDYFFGAKDYSAHAHYNQISLYFGFTYFFPRI